MRGTARLTRIYLQDHHAVIVAGEALANRVLGETADDEIRVFFKDLVAQFRDDRRCAAQMLGALGHRPHFVKDGLARIGEKVGRLKLNGFAIRHSPLSRVVELEGTRALLELDRALWRSLERAGSEGGCEDAAERASRLDALLARAEELRLVAAEVALAGGDRRL